MKDSLFGGEAFNDEALHCLRRWRQAGALAANQAHFATDSRFGELNEPQAFIFLRKRQAGQRRDPHPGDQRGGQRNHVGDIQGMHLKQ